MFYRLFLSDACLGRACYDKCKFKYDKSSADIRIGDLWGQAYRDNEDGVSAAIAFTDKGDEVLRQCGCTLVEHPFEVVAEGQMKTSPVRGAAYRRIRSALNDPRRSMDSVYQSYLRFLRTRKWKDALKHPLRTLVKLLHRILK